MQIDSIRLNSLSQEIHSDRMVVVKRRNLFSRWITRLANWYFRRYRIPILFCSDVEHWRQRELTCFQMLNRPFEAYAINERTICEEKLPGNDLHTHAVNGTLSPRMLRAAARELRHAHSRWSDEMRSFWSHGDACLPNVIYDERTDRARLIDFEIRHDPAVAAAQRHADDLMVFLLDLVSIVNRRRCLPMALIFLRAYDNPEVTEELRRRLEIPSGMARIWWSVRTNFAGSKLMQQRLDCVARALNHGIFRAARPAPAVQR